jgi:hypothetical protein
MRNELRKSVAAKSGTSALVAAHVEAGAEAAGTTSA